MLTTFFQFIKVWFFRLLGRRPPPPRIRKVVFVEGDELPDILPPFDLVVSREGNTLWSAGLVCPCGCDRRIEVMLLKGVKPRWDLLLDDEGLPTLKPSVWVSDGCRSHFWLRKGLIDWCDDRQV